MDATTYQREAARTLIEGPEHPLSAQQHMIVWTAIGLAGEAGEVLQLSSHYAVVDLCKLTGKLCEQVKKQIFHEQGLDIAALRGTLTGVCALLGMVARRPYYHAPAWLRPAFQKELGDCLWYVSALCSTLGLALADVTDAVYADDLAPIFQANIDKLRIRFPQGWDVADAAARRDVVEVGA